MLCPTDIMFIIGNASDKEKKANKPQRKGNNMNYK